MKKITLRKVQVPQHSDRNIILRFVDFLFRYFTIFLFKGKRRWVWSGTLYMLNNELRLNKLHSLKLKNGLEGDYLDNIILSVPIIKRLRTLMFVNKWMSQHVHDLGK